MNKFEFLLWTSALATVSYNGIKRSKGCVRRSSVLCFCYYNPGSSNAAGGSSQTQGRGVKRHGKTREKAQEYGRIEATD